MTVCRRSLALGNSQSDPSMSVGSAWGRIPNHYISISRSNSSALSASEYQKSYPAQSIRICPLIILSLTSHSELLLLYFISRSASGNLEPCNSWFFDVISILQIRVPSVSPWVALGAVLGEMPDTGSPETVEQFLILSCPLIISASGGPRVPAGFLLARL